MVKPGESPALVENDSTPELLKAVIGDVVVASGIEAQTIVLDFVADGMMIAGIAHQEGGAEVICMPLRKVVASDITEITDHWEIERIVQAFVRQEQFKTLSAYRLKQIMDDYHASLQNRTRH